MLEMLCHLEGPFLPTGREQYHNIARLSARRGFFSSFRLCARALEARALLPGPPCQVQWSLLPCLNAMAHNTAT